MGTNSVIYGFVARGPVVLAGRPRASVQQRFTKIANGCLQRLWAEDTGDRKLGYRADDHDFLFLTRNGYTYSVLVHNQDSNFAIKQGKLLLLLDHVHEEFCRRFGAGSGGIADTAPEYGLEEAFGPHLRSLIAAFHVENPAPTGLDHQILFESNKAQSKEVESVVTGNIERMMSQREEFEKIDITVEMTGSVSDEKPLDPRREESQQKVPWWKYWKTILIIIAILIALFLILFYSICDGIDCLT